MAIDNKLIDQLLSDYKKPEDIIGENGLLKELTKAILERALAAEMTALSCPRLIKNAFSESKDLCLRAMSCGCGCVA